MFDQTLSQVIIETLKLTTFTLGEFSNFGTIIRSILRLKILAWTHNSTVILHFFQNIFHYSKTQRKFHHLQLFLSGQCDFNDLVSLRS